MQAATVRGDRLVRFGAIPPAVLALIFVLAAAATAWAALDVPPLTGRVVDEAGLLTAAERQSLTETLKAHEQASNNQIVVVTLGSLRGLTIEDYGYQLGRAWGIGEKDKNTGALLIVAPKERKVRIEVGYGLEGVLTDAESRLIIENVILPAFRAGQFGPGIVAGTGAILKTLSGDRSATDARRAERRQDEAFPWALFFMLAVMVFLWFALSRRRWLIVPGPYYGGYGRRYDDHGGGFGSGGFSGGGFSGGGGSFGGGGASGSW